jgi:hypothetical protein
LSVRIRVPLENSDGPAWAFLDDGVWGLTTAPAEATTWPSRADALAAVGYNAPERVRFTGEIEEVP